MCERRKDGKTEGRKEEGEGLTPPPSGRTDGDGEWNVNLSSQFERRARSDRAGSVTGRTRLSALLEYIETSGLEN